MIRHQHYWMVMVPQSQRMDKNPACVFSLQGSLEALHCERLGIVLSLFAAPILMFLGVFLLGIELEGASWQGARNGAITCYLAIVFLNWSWENRYVHREWARNLVSECTKPYDLLFELLPGIVAVFAIFFVVNLHTLLTLAFIWHTGTLPPTRCGR